MSRYSRRTNHQLLVATGSVGAVLVSIAALGDAGALGAGQNVVPGGTVGGDAGLAADTLSFSQGILPIFIEYCGECHGGTNEAGEVVTEVSLNLLEYDRVMAGSEFGTVVEPGDPDGSFLIDQIESGDMPQERPKLSDENIALIRAWIQAGALNN